MPVNVIDACAMIAFLQDEEGAEVVESILVDDANDCVAHAINLCEVYKHYLKYETEADADAAVQILLGEAGISLHNEMDETFWKTAGKRWATITGTVRNPATGARQQIALADCFAIALAIRLGGTVITSDDEFTAVQGAGICPVRFFRSPGRRRGHSGPSGS